MSPWTILFSDEVLHWLNGLDVEPLKRVTAAIGNLEQRGHLLGTPYVKPIETSQHSNMKELRVRYGDRHYRILFAFDMKRRAALLLAGDKADIGWKEFYDQSIPLADEMFTKHQADTKKEIEQEAAERANSPKKGRKKK